MAMIKGGPAKIGLIGTVSRDRVIHGEGPPVDGPGGVLYQAAVLSALGEEVFLHGHCGDDLLAEVDNLAAAWPGLNADGLSFVSQPANRVRLRYSGEGEREEILEWAVPPFKLSPLPAATAGWDALLFVLNSGFDMAFKDWRQTLAALSCPAWLDTHSLVLEPAIGRPRGYRAVPDWQAWVKGAAWLQANRREVACLGGHPDRLPADKEVLDFTRQALDLGVRAAFVTLGPEGVIVAIRGQSQYVTVPAAGPAVDTTGCGDVFAAAALSRLVRGETPFEAAAFGATLASEATLVTGVRATWTMASAHRQGMRPGPGKPSSTPEGT
jgi:sugar/nucleoside kinase (ribokinase family)